MSDYAHEGAQLQTSARQAYSAAALHLQLSVTGEPTRIVNRGYRCQRDLSHTPSSVGTHGRYYSSLRFMLQQGMFGEQPSSSESHWHDHEYQLDPHRLQIRESPRQQGVSNFLQTPNCVLSYTMPEALFIDQHRVLVLFNLP